MSEVLTIIILTTLAGACIPLGGFLARFEKFRPQWLEKEFRHFLIAFGGGILIGAVAVVLVPEGKDQLSVPMLAIPIFLTGGICFFIIERLLGLRRREAPQLMGMVLDYVPEAIALGGMVAIEAKTAPLLAILIGLQNLPEGFNSYRELKQIKKSNDKNWTMMVMLSLVLLGPIAGLSGYYLLSDYPDILGGIMLFASGGILYLIFQDIAPQSKLNKHWAPPLGAILGFCLALFSEMLVGH
ncbi:divalent cation transporter [Kangiella profundi]|uniref:Divalent cation transporter n=1 Tax=Kangiella profundi TaxID=1561924 RepID=A0A2K9B4T8_9GAMM|nr:divalent cation transporter [Kangiella profundi]AUD79938.1 divalent cation transporter [Kangiella profundi]GGE94046.1 divalent cation transporter [Kangiella profundi]